MKNHISTTVFLSVLTGLQFVVASSKVSSYDEDLDVIIAIVVGSVLGFAGIVGIVICIVAHICREKKRKSRRNNRVHDQHGQHGQHGQMRHHHHMHMHSHMHGAGIDMYTYGDLPPAYAPVDVPSHSSQQPQSSSHPAGNSFDVPPPPKYQP